MRWVFLIFLFFVGWSWNFLVFAGIYTWVDEKGVVHIVDSLDKIPERYRENAETVNFTETPVTQAQPEIPKKKTSSVETKTSNQTDIYGRTLDWYLAEKKRWLKRVKELKKQIQENEQAMKLLRQRALKSYRGTRTEYGIKLGEGPIINRWVEYYRLRSINENLEKELKHATYMVEEGLVKQAASAYAPDEWLEIIRKAP